MNRSLANRALSKPQHATYRAFPIDLDFIFAPRMLHKVFVTTTPAAATTAVADPRPPTEIAAGEMGLAASLRPMQPFCHHRHLSLRLAASPSCCWASAKRPGNPQHLSHLNRRCGLAGIVCVRPSTATGCGRPKIRSYARDLASSRSPPPTIKA